MSKKQECFLCGNLINRKDFIIQTDSFRIVSDIAPLNEGHILISTNEHLYSLAYLDTSAINQLIQIKKTVRDLLNSVWPGKKVVFFEHGMGSKCDIPACGVEHAHLHALPIPSSERIFEQNILDFFKTSYLSSQLYHTYLKDYFDLLKLRGVNYLLTEDIDGSTRVFFSSTQFPSQILRKYLAKYLGAPFEYKWQLFIEEDKSHRTASLLRSHVNNFLWP